MSFGGQPGGGMGGGPDQNAFAMQISFKIMNAALSDCFGDCAQDFRSPSLSDAEKTCLQNCTARYFSSAELMSAVQ